MNKQYINEDRTAIHNIFNVIIDRPALEDLPDGVFDFVDAMPFLSEATV